MQKKVRIVALATAVIFLMGSLIPAGAADGIKSLKAMFKNYQIVVNGNPLISSEEPFIVDGRTYVPVRVIAEATGAKVDWDGAKGRVVVTTAPTVDKAQLDKSYREGYEAGLTAGELNGYLKGLQEGRSQIESEAKKQKDYDNGYKDGEAKGEADGFTAGESDFDRGRKSDWERAIDTDSSIAKTYRLSGKSENYSEGFLDGYKSQFKASYRDGYDSYDYYYDGYDDGWIDGYYDGYDDGESARTYNPRVPSSSTITSDYRLDSKSKTYRDGFIQGYKDNYTRGYEDGFDGEPLDPDRK